VKFLVESLSIMQALAITIILKFYTILTDRAIQKIRQMKPVPHRFKAVRDGPSVGRGDRSIVPLLLHQQPLFTSHSSPQLLPPY
jgi:hypothetical protein